MLTVEAAVCSGEACDIGRTGSVTFHADSTMRTRRGIREGRARARWKRRLSRWWPCTSPLAIEEPSAACAARASTSSSGPAKRTDAASAAASSASRPT